MAGYNFTDYHFVDPSKGVDSGAGTSMSDPWASLGYALNNMTKGSCVFLRRGQVETVTSAITVTKDHIMTQPGAVSSWPSPGQEGTGDFVKNSYAVSGVSLTVLSSGACCSRYMTGPDGGTYLMVDVDAKNTAIYIDPPYKGENAAAAAFVIDPDDLYSIAAYITSGQGADLKTTWDSDSEELYKFDCSANSSATLYFNQATNIHRYNIHFGKVNGNAYLVREVYPHSQGIWKHCYFETGEDNAAAFSPQYGSFYIEGCVIRGMSTNNTGQYGLYLFGCSDVTVKNTVIPRCGYRGVYIIGGGNVDLINCCVGFDGGNMREGVVNYLGGRGKDISGVRLIDSEINEVTSVGTAYKIYNTSDQHDRVSWTNYMRSAGDHRIYLSSKGYVYKTTSGARPGGSEYVLKCAFNENSGASLATRAASGLISADYNSTVLLDQHYVLSSGTWMFKYYVQSSGLALDSDDVFMDVVHWDGLEKNLGEAVVAHSSNGISSAGNWSEFIYASGIVIDADRLVEVLVYNNTYSATYVQYIDPQPQIIKLA